jgi:hypothetical protein
VEGTSRKGIADEHGKRMGGIKKALRAVRSALSSTVPSNTVGEAFMTTLTCSQNTPMQPVTAHATHGELSHISALSRSRALPCASLSMRFVPGAHGSSSSCTLSVSGEGAGQGG